MAESPPRRVALVSGASRGIGRAISRELAHRGCAVALGYRERSKAAAEALQDIEGMGVPALTLQLDVADDGACRRAAATVKERLGGLDILVNNAGIVDDSPALAMDDASWTRVIETCLTGAFQLARACAKFMVLGRWGRIINVSSVAARLGARGQANYAAAKAGLEGLTRSLAIELAPRGILVNAVAPGVVATDMSRPIIERFKDRVFSRILLGRSADPEEVAAVVGFLSSEDASYITGQVIAVDGGFGLNS